MFSKEFFVNNRRRLAASTELDLLVVGANGLLQKSADTTFPFRQDSNFWYLSGCEVAEAIIVIDKKTGKDYIILPRRLAHRDQWEGSIDFEELKRISGVDRVYSYVEGWQALKTASSKVKRIGTVEPPKPYQAHFGMYMNPAKQALSRRLKKLGTEFLDIRMLLARLRQIKTSDEVSALQQAIAITAKGLAEVHERLSSMSNERDISNHLTYSFAVNGASGHGYDPIVACGVNAATIHYEKNDAPLNETSLLLLDVGAQYGKYSADISRTWSLNTPTNRQQSVHDAVKRVHAYALSLLKPEMTLRAYEKSVREYMKAELYNLGLVGNADTKEHLKYFPHLTSHFLGIDVHDAGDYDAPIKPNTVITVEPGIYIPNEQIGVRIEDDVLITDTGYVNLSQSIPTDLVY